MVTAEEAYRALVKIERFALDHPNQPLKLDFIEGDSYLCTFVTDDWDNNDKDLDDPNYDEWFSLIFKVDKVLEPGLNMDQRYQGFSISKIMMPSSVTCNGKIIYKQSQ